MKRDIQAPGSYLPPDSEVRNSPCIFSLADTHNDSCFRENDLRLRDMKITFGKTLDLILQISHLLTILLLPRGQKYATMNYSIVV